MCKLGHLQDKNFREKIWECLPCDIKNTESVDSF